MLTVFAIVISADYLIPVTYSVAEKNLVHSILPYCPDLRYMDMHKAV